jgi:multiple sugar transport system permease protein
MKLAVPAKSLPADTTTYIEEGVGSRLLTYLARQFSAYLFLLPALIIFALVAWYPIVRAFEMSFQNVNLLGQSEWVGFDNYELMKLDPARSIIWKNTLQYLMWSITLGYAIPIICAILIREMRHGGSFFRIVYFLPTVVPISIAVIVWRFIYDPDVGFLNELIKVFGLKPQIWLNDIKLAKPSLVVIMTWGGFGTTTLIYLAAILEIPSELYEAAELDGASPLMRIRHITLPHLFPVMSLLFVLQIIFVVQVFTEPFILTKGNPARTTLTPVMHIYNKAFLRADMGYAAAWSVTLLIFLAVFSAIHLFIDRRLNNN